MNITSNFARLLLEADQLAEQGDLAQALELVQKMLGLSALWKEELAVVEARQAILTAALSEAEGEAEAKDISLDDDDAFEIVERDSSAPPSEEARAESLVNAGDLSGAIAVYAQICAADPDNSLTAERLQDLRRQWQLSQQPEQTAHMPAGTPSLDEAAAPVQDSVEEEPALVQKAASLVQAQLEASLADWRKDLPQDPVAMLQTLLDRVQRNRRPRP